MIDINGKERISGSIITERTMQIVIQPSVITGTIQAPASKSSMQRACAAALLSAGTTIIHNPGYSNDDQASLKVIEALGATWKLEDDRLIIESTGINPVADLVNCGESGLGIRMFAPLVALSEKEIIIDGEGSLLNRPMNFFDEVFPKLHVRCKSKDGKLPLTLQGPLQPCDIEIDGSLSSQFLTGLLMAYSAAGAKDVSITVKDLKSRPYIDLTLQVMTAFGLKIPENRNFEEFYFNASPANQSTNQPVNYTVEGDWSGAAFLLVAGAIAGKIRVKGMDVLSTQADKLIMQALTDCGAVLSVDAEHIEIGPVKGETLTAFDFDATDCPDLFPPLVALAAFCVGNSIIEGVHRLTHKESNRALTLQQEFGKMGVDIELKDDFMIIKGTGTVKGAVVHSHHDHRIAMACAVAGLRSEGEMVIDDSEAVNKSYRDFWNDLVKLDAVIKSSN